MQTITCSCCLNKAFIHSHYNLSINHFQCILKEEHNYANRSLTSCALPFYASGAGLSFGVQVQQKQQTVSQTYAQFLRIKTCIKSLFQDIITF